MDKPKVLVADSISPKGVELLESGGQLLVEVKTGLKEIELLAIAAEYSAIVVRSQTKITSKVIEAAKQLKVVGRAGVGVDNVDVDAATRRGVIVMNTPGGNTVSTAEHAFSLLVSIARNIPQADASMKAGKWDRKSFEGVELHGKTIGIFGMGRIGTEIARRVIAFGMRAIAYDPYLSPSRARSLQVELFEDLDQVLAQSDFVTMHMPLTAETKHLINADRIAKMKRGARIVNCARGGLIDEQALFEALQSGQIAAAALDVYETEPPPADFALRALPNVVFTPHLGASTAEAQESVSGGIGYGKLRVDSRTASSGAIFRCTADTSRFSSTALIPSTTRVAAIAPISCIGWRMVVSGGLYKLLASDAYRSRIERDSDRFRVLTAYNQQR